MSDRQKYCEYLEKKTNDKIAEQRLKYFDAFQRNITGDEENILSDIDIENFIKSFEWSKVEVQKAFDFLSDYGLFIQKESPEQNQSADSINRYCFKRFEAAGREAASGRKKTIVQIPEDTVVEFRHLGELTNVQFVSAFRELQKLVIKIYYLLAPMLVKMLYNKTKINFFIRVKVLDKIFITIMKKR